MAPARDTNTGNKDATGRVIWKGPRGGLFVRNSDGKKIPATAVNATSPRAHIDRRASALYTVAKQNRLNPQSRQLGCPLTFKMFSGSDLREGLRLGTEAGCFGTFDWIDEEDMENPVIWIAFANGKPVGYAGGHKAASGRSRFILSIICSKKNVTGCGNIGTHLMYQVEKEARRLGASYIELSSVVDAIRFYTRTGFVRADDPCASKEDKERADSRAKALFDKKVKKYIAEGLTIPESWHIYNGRFYPKEDRIISSSAVVLKKCILKKKTST